MKPRNRSLAGAAMAVFALPVFVGLTACLPTFPVPVGNPEKSTIDPAVTGVWLLEDEMSMAVFEPYDKRTWLLTITDIEEDPDSCRDGNSQREPEEQAEALEPGHYDATMAYIAALGADCFAAERHPGAIKVWRSRFRGEWFMTWESRGVFDLERGFEPEEWYVFHIDTSVPGSLRLGWIDTENAVWDPLELLEEEEITRAAVERIFRKHADEEGFYTDEDALVFERVRPEHLSLIADFIDDGML